VDYQNARESFAKEQIDAEISDLKKQIGQTEVLENEINKKVVAKEKTDSLAQSYVYQSLVVDRQNLQSKRYELQGALSLKNIESAYGTTKAKVLVAPALPLVKVGPQRKKIIASSFFIGLFLALIIAFLLDHYESKSSRRK
jgi:uncharacterized protein involved in exopolysaccharide biosynthesis